MGRDMHHPQAGPDEQHADFLGAGAFCEQFRMTSVVESGGNHGGLVQRRGYEGVDLAGHRHIAGREDIFDGCSPAGR